MATNAKTPRTHGCAVLINVLGVRSYLDGCRPDDDDDDAGADAGAGALGCDAGADGRCRVRGRGGRRPRRIAARG